jgi:hypothetical protein
LLVAFRWYDALCIDWRNPDKRPHQVRMWRDIYAAAKRVLACLEECESGSSGVGMQWTIEETKAS